MADYLAGEHSLDACKLQTSLPQTETPEAGYG